jgi:hypothetical protein
LNNEEISSPGAAIVQESAAENIHASAILNKAADFQAKR